MTESDRPGGRLDRALTELRPRSASPGFTHRVLSALDDAEQSRRPAANHRMWALGAVALAAVAVGVFFGTRPEPPVASLAAERESLKLEHDELMRELESLRTLALETRPVLYLGTGDDVDYVLDLSPLVAQPRGGAQPAALTEETGPRRYY